MGSGPTCQHIVMVFGQQCRQHKSSAAGHVGEQEEQRTGQGRAVDIDKAECVWKDNTAAAKALGGLANVKTG